MEGAAGQGDNGGSRRQGDNGGSRRQGVPNRCAAAATTDRLPVVPTFASLHQYPYPQMTSTAGYDVFLPKMVIDR